MTALRSYLGYASRLIDAELELERPSSLEMAFAAEPQRSIVNDALLRIGQTAGPVEQVRRLWLARSIELERRRWDDAT